MERTRCAGSLALGLLLLAGAAPTRADSPGSARNPIPLPGTEISTARRPTPAERDRVVLHRGALEATLYALPQEELGRGTDIRMAEDASSGTTPASAAAAMPLGEDAYAGHGLKLDIDPSWDVEVEDHYVRLNDDANPAAFGRASGEYWATAFGVELRF